ncbi:MAG: hypothetical protein R3B52_01475 [Candidatus Paceibacterota bacterium]
MNAVPVSLKWLKVRLAVLETGELLAWYTGLVVLAAAFFQAMMYGLWPYFYLWFAAGALWWIGKGLGARADALRHIVRPELNAGASRR